MKFLFCFLLTACIAKFCIAGDKQSLEGLIESDCRFNKSDCVSVDNLMSAVNRASKKFSIPNSRLLALIRVESKFRRKAYYLGNYGLMQVNAYWHKKKFPSGDLFNIDENVSVGASVLDYCQRRHADLRKAIGKCYNGGMDKGYYQKVARAEKQFKDIGVDKGDEKRH